jgi:predicted Rossmann fold nucleotide-binding protein DprA/Smf involved in DNA uptake
MIDALARAIDELETRRDRMMAEYQQIEEALNALRRVGTNDECAATPPAKPSKHLGRLPPPAPTGLSHHNRDTTRTSAILAFLKQGPARTGRIAQHLGTDRATTHLALLRLKQGGHLVHTGERSMSQWALPDKEAP